MPNYLSICDAKFPDINKTIELMKLSISGNEEATWEFVLSQASWIKFAISRYFPAYVNDSELVSDGIESLYKYAVRESKRESKKEPKKDISLLFLMTFRKYALKVICKDIRCGIRFRENQFLRKHSNLKTIPVHITSLQKETTCNDENPYTIASKITDICQSSVFDTVEISNNGSFFKSVIAKIMNSSDEKLKSNIQYLLSILEDNELVPTISRQAIEAKKRMLAPKLLKRFPELREIFNLANRDRVFGTSLIKWKQMQLKHKKSKGFKGFQKTITSGNIFSLTVSH